MNVPNKVTLLRIALIPVFMVLMLAWDIPGKEYIGAGIFFFCAMSDVYDGWYARKYNMVTDFGKFMDPIADKLVVTAALLVLMEWGKVGSAVTMVILTREFIVSALRMVAASKGIVLMSDNLGKLKTAFQDIAIIMLLLNNWPFALLNIPMDYITLGIAVFFTIWSGINYIVQNRHVLLDGMKEES